MTELLVDETTVPNNTYKTKEYIFLIFLESVTNFDYFLTKSLRYQQLILGYNFKRNH